MTSCLLLCTSVPFWKGIYSIRKERSKFFLFIDPFSEGRQKHFDRFTSPANVSISLNQGTCFERPEKILAARFLVLPAYGLYSLFHKSLRKQAYSNIIKILTPKNWKKKSDKNSDIFHISAKKIDCGYSLEPPRRGGSNEYPQSMFLSRNK